MQINGTLQFPPAGQPVDFATVKVSLQDISRMDAPAVTRGSVELNGVHVPETGLEVTFHLEADVDLDGAMLSLRAHADRTGSGRVEVGDYVTDTAHLLTAEEADAMVLSLRQVGK